MNRIGIKNGMQKYDTLLRQAEKGGRLQEECELITERAFDYGVTVREAEKILIEEGVLI